MDSLWETHQLFFLGCCPWQPRDLCSHDKYLVLIFFKNLITPYDMWDLNSQPGIDPMPPALGAQILNYWITGEIWQVFVYRSSTGQVGNIICGIKKYQIIWPSIAYKISYQAYFSQPREFLIFKFGILLSAWEASGLIIHLDTAELFRLPLCFCDPSRLPGIKIWKYPRISQLTQVK